MEVFSQNSNRFNKNEIKQIVCCSIFRDCLRKALINGGVAQLGEHLPCKQGVMGSNPIISTRSESFKKWRKDGRDTRLTKWAHSSAGQSACLISTRSVVRVHLSPPSKRTACKAQTEREPKQTSGYTTYKLLKAESDSRFEPTRSAVPTATKSKVQK